VIALSTFYETKTTGVW